jgi:hypothetical protein
MSSVLSSATHHIGREVSTNTVSSSGTRWFDVDINPSNPEVSLAVKDIGILHILLTFEGMYALKFHLSPVVVSTVECTPTGSRPHVGPSIE